MPEAVSASELLLQQIADRLTSIDAKLGQSSPAKAEPVRRTAQKSPAKTQKVTGR